MGAGQPTNRPPAKALSRTALGVAAGLVVGGGLLALVLAKRPAPVTDAAANADPRVANATPFRNARPDVKYVGDAACAQCHAEQAETYGRHPMGRSLAPAARAAGRARA